VHHIGAGVLVGYVTSVAVARAWVTIDKAPKQNESDGCNRFACTAVISSEEMASFPWRWNKQDELMLLGALR
jgi:hypothetical protein